MNMSIQPAISLDMSNLRDQQVAWLDHIVQSTGLTITEVARAGGLHPSTLTRFRNTNDNGHTLTSSTVRKIENATRVPAYVTDIRPAIQAFTENEAHPFIAREDAGNLVESALRSAARSAQNIHLWTLKTNSLSAVGYMAGMVVAVDHDAEPRDGDAVCAQKYDYRRGTAETIFRVYRTPYLLTASMSGEPGEVEIVDNKNVVIAGVIVGGFRLRH